jgi:AcrR family transcriptional regulator
MSKRREPRIGRPPGSTRDATRARILQAARERFAHAGYAGTTNKDIADAAGITSAAIYQYFESKTALYVATVKFAQAELVPEFERAVAEETETRAAFRALLAASARLHASDPSLAAFLSSLPVEMQREPAVAEAMAAEPSPVLEIVARMVDRGVRAGEIGKRDAPRVVAVFLACTMGFSLYAATFEGDDFVETMKSFLSFIEGGLVGGRNRKGKKAQP